MVQAAAAALGWLGRRAARAMLSPLRRIASSRSNGTRNDGKLASANGLRTLVSLRRPSYARGSVNENVDPLPSSLSTETSPPWDRTMCFTSANPSPVPSPERALSAL